MGSSDHREDLDSSEEHVLMKRYAGTSKVSLLLLVRG